MQVLNALATQVKAVFVANKTVSLVILGIGIAIGAFLF